MAAAASIVKGILSKWGDDITNATKELTEAGYPGEVAGRIASGELPMDDASRLARAADQNYGGLLYRGHGPSGISSDADWWASSSPHVAETYKNNLQSNLSNMFEDDFYDLGAELVEIDVDKISGPEAIKDIFYNYDQLSGAAESEDVVNAAIDYAYATEPFMEDITIEAAKAESDLRKAIAAAMPQDAVVSPIRTNAQNLAEVNAKGKNWRTVETNSNKLKGLQTAESSRGVHKGTDQIAEAVKDSESYDGVRFKNISDEAISIPENQRGDTYNILASRPDVNIRHADAAFDPQYTGPNIMGGLLAGGLGLGALGQSEDADAMPALLFSKGIDAGLAAKQLRNKINKENQKGISGEKSVADYIHRNSNYEKGFIDRAKKWDSGLNGEAYTTGINSLADDIIAGTDDPLVHRAVESWRESRLDAGRHNKYGRGNQIARAAVAPATALGAVNAASAAPQVQDSGMINAPRSETLFDMTMGARDIERRLEGSPASLLFPSGLIDYLESVNSRVEDPSWGQRGAALLDVLPL
jgi:hypothetical protein